MKVLRLDDEQIPVLREHLQRLLSDLSVEIASTDRKDYRDEIKIERRVLEEVLAQLDSIDDAEHPGEPLYTPV